jgi:hypothetical protein
MITLHLNTNHEQFKSDRGIKIRKHSMWVCVCAMVTLLVCVWDSVTDGVWWRGGVESTLSMHEQTRLMNSYNAFGWL